MSHSCLLGARTSAIAWTFSNSGTTIVNISRAQRSLHFVVRLDENGTALYEVAEVLVDVGHDFMGWAMDYVNRAGFVALMIWTQPPNATRQITALGTISDEGGQTDVRWCPSGTWDYLFNPRLGYDVGDAVVYRPGSNSCGARYHQAGALSKDGENEGQTRLFPPGLERGKTSSCRIERLMT